jgi:ribonuclease H|nr:MAG TPA: RNAseH-like protein [Caudoviricetes sp.]
MKSSRKLNIKDIFNKDSIAVFVDASVNVERNTACSGAVIVDENFDTKYTDVVLSEATNVKGELVAIKIGIEEGLKTHRKIINLFSDSEISVKSLKEWLFKWEKKGRHKKILLNSNGEEAVHSAIIMEIVEMIVKNSHVNINIFHQKGHIGSSSYPYSKIKRLFHNNNGFIIDDNFIDIMKTYNDMVDHYTKNSLNIAPTVGRNFTPHVKSMFNIDSEVIQKYKKLATIDIGGSKKHSNHNSKFRVRKFRKSK